MHPLQITLYPNPAGNIVRADILLPRAEVLKISILNLLGQEVLSQTSPQRLSVHQLPLDLSTLPNGVYLVRVSAGGFSGSEKLIVNH
ncbi:MAG: T9SS type A sorting domain-containing protein [Bacteroidetes bacterium]|nr:T9SS type A sorting domain-containing protein [Bacteroidota bacterium]